MRSSKVSEKDKRLLQVIEDPAQFAEAILGHEVWSKQREMLQSVASHACTAVKACHASGKTFTAAEAVLWWITSHEEAIAVTTAPTWTQVERLLWGEIRSAISGARIQYPKPSNTAWHLGPSRYAIGLSTNEGVRFQGFHGNVLIVLDEAPGVLPEIWEAIEGIRAGGDVRVLALGNPTIASGPFYEAFTSNRENWNLVTISAFDTPNLEGITLETLLELPEEELNYNPYPYLTTRRWVKERNIWNGDPSTRCGNRECWATFPRSRKTHYYPCRGWKRRSLARWLTKGPSTPVWTWRVLGRTRRWSV
jgi:hypothetical protein